MECDIARLGRSDRLAWGGDAAIFSVRFCRQREVFCRVADTETQPESNDDKVSFVMKFNAIIMEVLCTIMTV